MNSVFTYLALLGAFSMFLALRYNKLSSTLSGFVRNNGNTKVLELGLATASHWMFAIAIFFGTGIAYKFGYIGLLYFTVPNILSLVWMGMIASAARKKDKTSNSLIEFVKKNCSKRVSYFFQLELIILALSALTLTFIAIKKVYIYSGLEAEVGISQNIIIFSVLVFTLIQALSGGIKTSIFSGSVQGILWLVFAAILFILLPSNSDLNFSSATGVQNITSFFDPTFLKTFGIFTAISLTVGATSHGSLWMKTYSRRNPNQHKSYYVAAAVFGITILSISLASLSYVSYDNSLKDVQTSVVKSIELLGGKTLLSLFILLVFFHSSSLIDAYCNFCSNLISVDNKFLNKDSNIFKVKIFTGIMILGAYFLFLSGISIWMVFGIMSIARIVNFFPLINICFEKKINEPALFNIILGTLVLCFGLFLYGKMNKASDFVMWSGIIGFLLPLVLVQLTKKKI